MNNSSFNHFFSVGKKYFANSKTLRTFAAHYILDGGVTRLLLVAGFFISVTQIYGSVPPRTSVIDVLPSRCNAEGKAEPLFISAQQTNICKMHYTETTCLKGNNSTQQTTPTERNTVSIEAFNIEENAKNKAYAFILHHKLLNAFSEFCKATANVQDPHELCLTLLNEKL